ncbi:putative ribonuclease H-like domain-containing protein [Tanacetum coccineum]
MGQSSKIQNFIELCGEKGIKRDYSNPRTPQQNGVAERKNRTLIEAARTMLADSKLPTMFWTEAVSTACYVLNRVLHQAMVLVVMEHNKIMPKSLLRFIDKHMKLRTQLHDRLFVYKKQAEILMQYVVSDPAGGNLAGSFQPAGSYELAGQGNPIVSNLFFADFIPVHSDEFYTSSLSDKKQSSKIMFGESASLDIIKINKRTNHTDNYIVCLLASFLSLEPTSKLRHLRILIGLLLCKKRCNSFINQKVWTLVPLPDGKNAIGTKWILKNKRDARGIVVRNKARLVAQGHRQEEGIDYDEMLRVAFRYGEIGRRSVWSLSLKDLEDHYFPACVTEWLKLCMDLHHAPRACVDVNFGQKVLWIQNQLLDYGFNFMNTKIFIDTQSTICIVKNPLVFLRTKHIGLAYFIRDAKNEKNLIRAERFTPMIMWLITDKHLTGPDLSIGGSLFGWWFMVFCGILFSCDCRVCVPAGVHGFLLLVNFFYWLIIHVILVGWSCFMLVSIHLFMLLNWFVLFDIAGWLVSATSHSVSAGSLQSCWYNNVSAE